MVNFAPTGGIVKVAMADPATGKAVGEPVAPLIDAGDTTSAGVAVSAGTYFFAGFGTWDGAALQLQWSPNNTDWFDIGSALSADGVQPGVSLASGFARAEITSAGTTEITAILERTG